MIKYRLQCAAGHGFDEWFDNMADYDNKAAAGELACPECGGKQVEKAIMAPRVGTGDAKSTDSTFMPMCPNTNCGGCG